MTKRITFGRESETVWLFSRQLQSEEPSSWRNFLSPIHLLTHSLTHSQTGVQTGKYENRGTLIPIEELTCLVCKENCIEHCQGYTTLRRELHSHILNPDTRYTSQSDNKRTKYLLRADNKVASKIIGTYTIIVTPREYMKHIFELQRKIWRHDWSSQLFTT